MKRLHGVFGSRRGRRLESPRHRRPAAFAAAGLRAEPLERRALLAVTVPPDITSDVIEIDDNVLVATGAATIEATAGYVQIFGNSRGRIDAVNRTDTSGLTLKATSAITVTGAIGSITPLDSLTLTASATHPVNLQQAVTLDDDLVVTRAGSVTFGSTLVVGDDLTITQAANVLFSGNVTVVGDLTITSAAAVTFSGTLTVGGSLRIVDATGAVRFLGDVSVAAADVTSRDRVIAQAGFGSTGAGGTAGDVSFTTDQIGFNAAIISTSAAASSAPTATLTVKPRTTTLPIMVASPPGVPTGLLITDAAISAIQGGWKRVVFGDEVGGTGAVTVGSIGSQYGFSQLLNTTTIVGGSLTVVQPVDATPQAAYLDLVARSGAITLKSPINQSAAERNDWVRLTAAGAISVEAPVWAARAVSLTTTAGGTVSQKDGVTAAISAPSLAVDAAGGVTLADSGNAFDTIAIMTTDDDVVLREDSGYAIGEVETTDASRASTATVTVTGIKVGVGTVRLVTVDAVATSVEVTQTEAILAGALGLEGADTDWTLSRTDNQVGTLAAAGATGSVTYRDAGDLTIGSVAAVAPRAAIAGIVVSRTADIGAGKTLTLDATGDVVAGGTSGTAVRLAGATGIVTSADVTTSGGDALFSDATRLVTDVTIALAGTGTVGTATFLSTVDGTTSGQESLTVTGNLDAGQSLGDTTAFQNLSVSGDSTLAGGITVRTVGDQTFSGKATSAGTVTVQAGTGATVKFLGDTTLGGLVTRTTDAADYAVTMAGSKSVITDAVAFTNIGAVRLGVNATDDLWFKAGVTSVVPSSTSLAGTIRTTDAAATFGQKTPVNHAITLLADTTVSTGAGNATFSGTVDGARRLVVNASGDTTFSSAVGGTTALAHVETDAGGRTLLDGGSVTTSSPTSQLYNDAVILGADTVLTAGGGGSIGFASTLDGAWTLAVNTQGVTTFSKAVGGTTPLVSLTTDKGGTTAIDGGTVTTSGLAGQVFNDAVTLGVATMLAATNAGAVAFADTLDGPGSLTVNTQGTTTFSKAVGGTTPLVSLTTDEGGTTAIDGGTVTTSGLAGQVFNDAVTLGAGTTLAATNAGAVTFASTLDGGWTLAVNTQGATTFSKAVGGTTPLVSLSTDGGGTTAIDGGTITTSGPAGQTYGDAVTLGDDTTLTGDTVTTLGTLTGSGHDLTIAGTAILGDAPEDIVSGLASLTVTGIATVNTSKVAATGIQTWKKTVTLGTDATFENGTLSFEDPIVGGGHDLTLTGSSVILGDAPADSVTGVDDLLITGPTVLNGNTITTTGTQTFNGGVTATQATAVVLSGKGLDFKQALDRGEPGIVPPLTLTAGTDGVTFGGDVGTSGRPFGTTEVRSQGGVSLTGTLWSNGPVTVASTLGAISGGATNAIRTSLGTIRLEAATGIGTQAAPIGIEAVGGVTAATTSGGIFLRAVEPTGNLWIGPGGLVAPAGPIGLDARTTIGVLAGGRIQAGVDGVTTPIPITWSVTTTVDGGAGSLRQVILNLNEVGNANRTATEKGLDARLSFEVPTVSSLPVSTVFTLATALPEIRAAVSIVGFHAGVVIDGNSSVAAANGLVFGAAASGSALQGVTLRNFREYAIQLRAAQGVTVNRVTVRGLNLITSMGVYATGNLAGTVITGGTFTGGLRGALLDGARDLQIVGNTFADNKAVRAHPTFAGTGIRAQGDCAGTVVQGNAFSGNNYGFAFMAARNLALRNNSFARNNIAGIYVEGNCTGSSQSGSTFATATGQRNRVNVARARNSRGV